MRGKSHLNTRLALYDERSYAKKLLKLIAPVYVLFGLVDYNLNSTAPWYFYFGLRLSAVVLSRIIFVFSRGRAPYATRIFLAGAPYVFTLEYLMYEKNLWLTPYYSGIGLVLMCITMVFPSNWKYALIGNVIYILPIFAYLLYHPLNDIVGMVTLMLMTIGTVLLAVLNSDQIYRDLRKGLIASEALARDKGKRGRIIDEKAKELINRRIFESQFSPQVVAAILKDRSLVNNMVKRKISNVVIDIEESTKKANALEPDDYKQVIEEVLDVFSAACLKWNVTLDKFIGDGVQAFAGAPFQSIDDENRAVMACKDTISMLKARKDQMEILWKGPMNVRFAICTGEALVGFVGKGIFKSYTAIGDMVSFTHRLSSVPAPWTVALYVWDASHRTDSIRPGFNTQQKLVSNLKGFNEKTFEVSILNPIVDDDSVDAGRCETCGTPMVIEDGLQGLPRVYCPACSSQLRKIA